jgi:hypothetical protein
MAVNPPTVLFFCAGSDRLFHVPGGGVLPEPIATAGRQPYKHRQNPRRSRASNRGLLHDLPPLARTHHQTCVVSAPTPYVPTLFSPTTSLLHHTCVA